MLNPNLPPRLVYCSTCKREEMSAAHGVIECGCGGVMVVALRSLLDGEYYHRRPTLAPLWLADVVGPGVAFGV